MGFWRGYLVFCLVWAGLGLAVLSAWLRVEPWFTQHVGCNLSFKKERARLRPRERSKSWRDRLVLRLAGVGRLLGTLGTVVVLGPVFGWVAFRLLGYRERDVYVLTIAAAWGFGALWVPFYGLGVWSWG